MSRHPISRGVIRSGLYLYVLFEVATVLIAARDSSRMNAIPQLSGPGDLVDWSTLPTVVGQPTQVFAAEENVAGYNMHPCVSFYKGRWWAAWSSGAWGEDLPGQKILVASSPDGLVWSKPKTLAVPRDDFMLTPTGFWIRGDDLLITAYHCRAKRVVEGVRQPLDGSLDPILQIYRCVPNDEWELVTSMADTFNDKPVQRLSTGEWVMISATEKRRRYFCVGGQKSLGEWTRYEIPEPADHHEMAESHFFELPDGGLVLLYRDDSRSQRIYRGFSEDRGKTWSPPVATDFPDQRAKFSVLKMQTGEYLLASNPRVGQARFPLCLSFSNDGLIFDRIVTVVAEQPGPFFPNFTKRRGAQYPQLLEVNGDVVVIFSFHQESIALVKIAHDQLVSAGRKSSRVRDR